MAKFNDLGGIGETTLGGYTSINFAVELVSTPLQAAHSVTSTGPASSSSRDSGSV